ncbi:hypothetical protein [Capnocytophaga felis]|uniref:Uncharacterized protein n=1 Tax=Capnocytophaga felis TaxID=2267611 RepID=A0A5M4BC70_9FLAO|nr:hypothetical protein [Capnocytophaga felis]GET47163.1 hypothetical protein RCZ01_24650 [Capnocytophaga felis]GET49723.1 hypothetical protein RCZ02_25540 [Capnocytophaga felis]
MRYLNEKKSRYNDEIKISVWWYIITAAFVGWCVYDKAGKTSFAFAFLMVCALLIRLAVYGLKLLKAKYKRTSLKKSLNDVSDKHIAYRDLNNFVYYCVSKKQLVNEAPFVREKLKEIISQDSFIVDLEIREAVRIMAFYKDAEIDDAFLDVYDLIIFRSEQGFKHFSYSNYDVAYALSSNLIYLHNKHPFINPKITELEQKFEQRINQMIGEYNVEYPYGDKPCYADFKVGVVNKRTSGGAIYYDEQNAIDTTLYIFDDIIEIHNLHGIKKMNIKNIVKIEENKYSTPTILFPSTGGTMNLKFESDTQEWYFIQLINMLKSK